MFSEEVLFCFSWKEQLKNTQVFMQQKKTMDGELKHERPPH